MSVRCHFGQRISLLWQEPPKFSGDPLNRRRAVTHLHGHRVKAYKAVYMHERVCYLVQCAFAGRLERATEVLSGQAATICS